MATKQYSSKVCYVFSGLTIAFTIAIIYWVYQEKDISTTPTFQNSDLKVNTETNCKVEPLVGDGYCDDEANNVECDYDLDDCCQAESDRSSCTNCTCWIDNDQLELIKADFCQKQNPLGALYLDLGDGYCDLDLNTKEYLFDIGDCCIQDPICLKDELPGVLTNLKTEVPCPDNICIESNQYCIEHELGDGLCQDHNNGPYCDYDLGDCCYNYMTVEGYDCCTCACRFKQLNFETSSSRIRRKTGSKIVM